MKIETKKVKEAVVKEVEKAGNSPAGFSVKKYDEAGPDDIVLTSRGYMKRKTFDMYNRILAKEFEKRIGERSMSELYAWLEEDRKTIDDLLAEYPNFWRDDSQAVDLSKLSKKTINDLLQRGRESVEYEPIEYEPVEAEPVKSRSDKEIAAEIKRRDQLLIVFAICAAVVLSFISISFFFVVAMVGFIAGGLAFISALK